MNRIIFIFYLFLVILLTIKAGYVKEINDISFDSKFENIEYIRTYKIPLSLMSFDSNGGSQSTHPLLNAFDENFNSFWRSFIPQKDTFLNDIKITFAETVTIDRMIYQAPLFNQVEGKGYPIQLNVFFKLRGPDGILSNDESDFLLADVIFSERTGNKVVFMFEQEIVCDQIKLEWAQIDKIHGDLDYNYYAFASEIILLYPENEYINKLIFELFQPNDYYQLNINSEYNNFNAIQEIEDKLIDYLNIYDYLRGLVNRAKQIVSGKLKYEKKREFTTNQRSKVNIINQYGDVNKYSKNTLRMSRGGTNRQPTGIYAFSNDTITIYVDANDDDPLPIIKFTQYIGVHNKWLSPQVLLKKGKNVIKVHDFDITGIEVKVRPGGPIYIENKYTSDEQSQNVKIYIEGGVLFPYFRLDDDEEEFKKTLSDYVEKYNKTSNIYYNIAEFYSNRVMITLNATFAYLTYNIKGESPQKNLVSWDEVMKTFYTFDGIQFEESQPYYDIKNQYINIHIRYSQNYKKGIAAYASEEHIGIFYQEYFHFSLVSYEEIGRSLGHEIGHMIDVKERELAEFTNLVLQEFTMEVLYRDLYTKRGYESLYKILAPDNIDNSLRNCHQTECKGFFINSGSYSFVFTTWWSIESFYPGYWGKLDNMYRYNTSLNKGMNKNELMIYFTSLIVGFDTSYHFERFGLAMVKNIPFKISSASKYFNNSMEEAINQGKINNTIYKKFWYIDSDEYNYRLNNGTGCYKNENDYDVEINSISRDISNKKYNITLPYINCTGHLGFEIVENQTVIGFTKERYFIDETEYSDDYTPIYKIVAYDRLLDYKESNYASFD